jgi:serine/threonine-protein kinase
MIGTAIHNYRIVSRIGEGGMGEVYLAEHAIMGRHAAIKVLRHDLARDTTLVARFFNEARAANAIRHPNIIEVLDVGLTPDGERPYLLMEYLQGETLARRIERIGRLTSGKAVDIALQTASALSAAHGAGVIHRDLKPENLFLVPPPGAGPGQGAQEIVKVVDFGVAKLRAELRGDDVRTASGAVLGTPEYMSPEQCRGAGVPVDERSDIYSLGVILYHMLCGHPPFVARGFGDILIMHVTEPPAAPRLVNPEISAALEAVVLRALAKSPPARHPSMDAFAAALREAQLDGSEGHPPVPFGLPGGGGRYATVLAGPDERAGGPPLARRDTEVLPRQRPRTTLSSTTGELDWRGRSPDAPRTRREPGRRRPFAAAVGAGMAVAALLVALVSWRMSRSEPAPPPPATASTAWRPDSAAPPEEAVVVKGAADGEVPQLRQLPARPSASRPSTAAPAPARRRHVAPASRRRRPELW